MHVKIREYLVIIKCFQLSMSMAVFAAIADNQSSNEIIMQVTNNSNENSTESTGNNKLAGKLIFFCDRNFIN